MQKYELYEIGKFNSNVKHELLGVFDKLDIASKVCDLLNLNTTVCCAVYLDNELVYDTSDI